MPSIPCSGLVGLSVTQGFPRAVNERLGRAHGPLPTRLLANDVEGLRSLSAHRLAQGPGGRGVDTGAPRT